MTEEQKQDLAPSAEAVRPSDEIFVLIDKLVRSAYRIGTERPKHDHLGNICDAHLWDCLLDAITSWGQERTATIAAENAALVRERDAAVTASLDATRREMDVQLERDRLREAFSTFVKEAEVMDKWVRGEYRESDFELNAGLGTSAASLSVGLYHAKEALAAPQAPAAEVDHG